MESEPGRGATFVVDVPLEVGQPSAVKPPSLAKSLAGFFRIPVDEAKALIALTFDSASWSPGPAEGTELMPVSAGDGIIRAFLVRIRAGATYPVHEHVNEERLFVFQGGLREPGREIWAGERTRNAQGTRHSSTALPGDECLLAAIEVPG